MLVLLPSWWRSKKYTFALPCRVNILFVLTVLFSLFLAAQVWAEEAAEPARLAIHSLLLDGAQYQNKMIVVGERGHILYSEDQGHNWIQARVPTRVLLTSVFLLDKQHAWAVGHDATIIKSSDGGQNWQLSYSAPDKETPLLDIWFKDKNRGFAVGGYGLFLETRDGGKNWQQRWISEEDDFHLNDITPALSANGKKTDANTLFIAAESGVIYRSTDGGASWRTLSTPYPGSFFAALPIASNQLSVFGLRGHLFLSQDNGENWQAITTGTTAMLTHGIKTKTGQCILSGLSGVLLVDNQCNGKALTLIQRPDRSGISALLESDDGELVLIGEAGITRFRP